MEKRNVIIIGSGPAGISTALSVKKWAPDLSDDLLVLEKEQHPRHKLCGGGVTPYADQILSSLGVHSGAISFPIHKVRFHFDSRPIHFFKKNIMRVVRRDEFDADLVQQAKRAGIEVRENEPVRDLRKNKDGVEVVTANEIYQTRVLVGADGAKSLVRKKAIQERSSRVSRLMEVLLKVDAADTEEFREKMVVLDFRPTRLGLQGYLWNFPSFIGDTPYLNIGIFDSRVRKGKRADLKDFLTARLAQRGIPPGDLHFMGHPERWFAPNGRYSCPNVLLVGDAAGIEPWLGEGISAALAYGPVAARAIKKAFESNDFSFASYPDYILRNKLGKFLRRNRFIAWNFYSRTTQFLLPHFVKLWEMYINRKLRTPSRLDDAAII